MRKRRRQRHRHEECIIGVTIRKHPSADGTFIGTQLCQCRATRKVAFSAGPGASNRTVVRVLRDWTPPVVIRCVQPVWGL